MQRLLVLAAALLTGCLLAGCALWSKHPVQTEPASPQATINGRVAYRERMALPPGVALRVTLEDISRADAPAEILAEKILYPRRQVPIPFSLDYDSARIRPRHRYALRAQIRSADGRLLWTSDTVHPVLTRGAPADSVEIALVRAGREPRDHGMAPQKAGQTYVYECADGEFDFTTRTGPGELALWLPARFGRPYLVLSQVRAASGAKYREGDVVVWTKGAEALLEVGDEVYTGCKEDRRH